jgi:hypothetical protein
MQDTCGETKEIKSKKPNKAKESNNRLGEKIAKVYPPQN